MFCVLTYVTSSTLSSPVHEEQHWVIVGRVTYLLIRSKRQNVLTTEAGGANKFNTFSTCESIFCLAFM